MTKQNDDDWPVTTKRYVGYIDIMGFKDMVTRNTHDAIYQMMKKIDDKKNLAKVSIGVTIIQN